MLPKRQKLFWSGGEIELSPCRVMGVLNITPDSFSDGGRYFEADRAVGRAWEMFREGVDILDVGAQSTRPGASQVSEEEERARLVPVLKRLALERFPAPISLDCDKPLLVKDMLRNNWVHIINDVTGLRQEAMVDVVKEYDVPVVIMHMFGNPKAMQEEYHYDDVVADVKLFLQIQIQRLGRKHNIILDPGIGFGKSVTHNLLLLKHLSDFEPLGQPLLVGASRKSFVGKLLHCDVGCRLEGSLAAAVVAAMNGANIVRVHDVAATKKALALTHHVMDPFLNEREPSVAAQVLP